MQLEQHLLWEALTPGILHGFPTAQDNPFHMARLPLAAFSVRTPKPGSQEATPSSRCLQEGHLFCPRSPPGREEGSKGQAGLGVGRCQLLVYTAWSPAGDTLGGAAKLTWVNQALLPFRVGDDLVFIHHLDVLILHLIAAGREKAEGSTLAVRPR